MRLPRNLRQKIRLARTVDETELSSNREDFSLIYKNTIFRYNPQFFHPLPTVKHKELRRYMYPKIPPLSERNRVVEEESSIILGKQNNIGGSLGQPAIF